MGRGSPFDRLRNGRITLRPRRSTPLCGEGEREGGIGANSGRLSVRGERVEPRKSALASSAVGWTGLSSSVLLSAFGRCSFSLVLIVVDDITESARTGVCQSSTLLR